MLNITETFKKVGLLIVMDIQEILKEECVNYISFLMIN